MKKILLVEDEPLIAAVVSATFQKHGFSVLGPFDSVDAALALLARETPDAALLDVNLYQEHSYPIAMRLREMRVPYAFFTAYENASLPEGFENDPVIAKNLPRAEIVERISALLA